MELLAHLSPTEPRVTVYNEALGSRVEFSALTLTNWAAKVANMLREECDLTPGDAIALDVPHDWQEIVIVLGALAAGVTYQAGDDTTGDEEGAFVGEGTQSDAPTGIGGGDDPRGAPVADLPAGALDFSTTVRMYADDFPEPTASLAAPGSPTKRIVRASASTVTQTLEQLATGGAIVIVRGAATDERMTHIADVERATAW